MDKIIDPKFGFDYQIERVNSYPGLPSLNIFVSQGRSIKNEEGKKIIRRYSEGTGVSKDKDTAINRAIGESMERYCSSYIDPDDIFYNLSYKELENGKAIHPRRFQHYTDSQYKNKSLPFKRIDEYTRIDWVETTSLIDNSTKLTPADVVYCPYLDGGQFRENITNGLACHTNLNTAILGGLLELIERDSIMITWKNFLSLPIYNNDEIKSRNNNPHLSELLNECHYSNLDVIFIDITLDLEIPIVFCLIKNKLNQLPFIACGASCQLNVFDAMTKSLEEALVGFHFTYIAEEIPERIEEIRTIEDHLFYYASGKDLENLQFLYSSRNKANIDEKQKYASYSLQDVIKLLKDRDIEILYKDLTTPDIEAIGLKTVRVISPELFFIDFKYPGFNNKRLHTVPEIINANNLPYFNENPHPFP
nr:YcaO-like family protein [Ornithinibacillus massiliensis]